MFESAQRKLRRLSLIPEKVLINVEVLSFTFPEIVAARLDTSVNIRLSLFRGSKCLALEEITIIKSALDNNYVTEFKESLSAVTTLYREKSSGKFQDKSGKLVVELFNKIKEGEDKQLKTRETYTVLGEACIDLHVLPVGSASQQDMCSNMRKLPFNGFASGGMFEIFLTSKRLGSTQGGSRVLMTSATKHLLQTNLLTASTTQNEELFEFPGGNDQQTISSISFQSELNSMTDGAFYEAFGAKSLSPEDLTPKRSFMMQNISPSRTKPTDVIQLHRALWQSKQEYLDVSMQLSFHEEANVRLSNELQRVQQELLEKHQLFENSEDRMKRLLVSTAVRAWRTGRGRGLREMEGSQSSREDRPSDGDSARDTRMRTGSDVSGVTNSSGNDVESLSGRIRTVAPKYLWNHDLLAERDNLERRCTQQVRMLQDQAQQIRELKEELAKALSLAEEVPYSFPSSPLQRSEQVATVRDGRAVDQVNMLVRQLDLAEAAATEMSMRIAELENSLSTQGDKSAHNESLQLLMLVRSELQQKEEICKGFLREKARCERSIVALTCEVLVERTVSSSLEDSHRSYNLGQLEKSRKESKRQQEQSVAIGSLKSREAALEAGLEKSHLVIEQLTGDRKTMESVINQLSSSIAEYERAMNCLQSEKSLLLDKVEVTEQKVQASSSTMTSLSQTISRLEQENARLVSQQEAQFAFENALTAELQRSQVKNEELCRELRLCKEKAQQLTEMHAIEAVAMKTQLTDLELQLRASNRNLNDVIADRREVGDRLMAQEKVSEQQRSRVLELCLEIQEQETKLAHSLQVHKCKESKLAISLELLAKELESCRKHIADINQALASMETERDCWKKECSVLSDRFTALELDLSKKEQQMQTLGYELQHLQHDLSKKETSFELLSLQKDLLAKKLTVCEDQKSLLEAKATQLEIDLQTSKQAQLKLSLSIDSLSENTREISQKVACLNLDLEERESIQTVTAQRNVELVEELKKAQNELKLSADTSDGLKVEVICMSEDNLKLQSERESLQTELRRLHNRNLELEDSQRLLQQERDQLTARVAALTDLVGHVILQARTISGTSPKMG